MTLMNAAESRAGADFPIELVLPYPLSANAELRGRPLADGPA